MAEACAKMLQPEFNIVGVVTDGRAFVQKAIELKPDIAIIDVSMPQLNGLDAAEQVKRKVHSVRLVFLTMISAPAIAADAFRRGASAYVLEYSGADEFMAELRRVMRGESYLSPVIARETMTYLLQKPKDTDTEQQLTRRQTEILQLLAEGRRMKEIADILNITMGTVAFHKYSLMNRLGITSNAGLLLYAMKHTLTPAVETEKLIPMRVPSLSYA